MYVNIGTEKEKKKETSIIYNIELNKRKYKPMVTQSGHFTQCCTFWVWKALGVGRSFEAACIFYVHISAGV